MRVVKLGLCLVFACAPRGTAVELDAAVSPSTDAGDTDVDGGDASACRPSDGRDPRTRCWDPRPSCEGEAGRILEVRVPAPPGFSRAFLGYPVDETFRAIPGASSLFEGAPLRETTTDVTRAEIHDFESERGRDAHARACLTAGTTVPGTRVCVGFESGASEAYDYRAVHLVSSRRFVHVDDLSVRLAEERVPPEALWYYYGLELGHAVDLRAWTREMSRVRGFELSVDLPSLAGSGAPCGGSGCDDSGRHVLGSSSFAIGAGFRDFAAREGYELSALLRGFRLDDAGACFASARDDEFGGCFRPSDEPAMLFVTLRNIPSRCIPPDRRVDRPRPLEARVELTTLDVEDAFGDEASWSLRPYCEVEPGVSLGVPLESVVLSDVRRGAYTLTLSTQGGVVPGQVLRCGVVGDVAARGSSRPNVPFAASAIEIPNDATAAEIPFEIVAPSAYRVRGGVTVRALP